MNYTNTKTSVIFQIPLSDYFGQTSGRRYNKETKEWTSAKYWINSIQDWEESSWDNFESFYSYIDLKDYSQYYDLIEAEKYLISRGYTQEEIDAFRSTLEADQVRALADARDASYHAEYSQKLYKMIMEQARADLDNALGSLPFRLLDDITNQDFQRNKTDQEYIRLEINKADIRDLLKKEGHLEGLTREDQNSLSLIDIFQDNYLDYSRRPVDQEYIDRYGSLGDSDDWLECFQNYNEISAEIDAHRLDEAAKIDNLERAALELKPQLDAAAAYIDKYIKKEPAKTKINRQIGALKSVIKNAA